MDHRRVIALTGATGFVGRHTIPALLAEGHAVRVLARNAGAVAVHDSNVKVVEGSLENTGALLKLSRGADAVIHMAGAIAAPDRASFDEVNVAGTARLARVAEASGVSRFVHVSSLAAREPGLSDYGASKKAGERALESIAEKMKWAIVRPPAVYGPGDKGTLPLFAQLSGSRAIIPGSRKARVSLIYVEDLAKAVVALVDDGTPHGKVHELHDGKQGGYSWPELVELAARARGRQIRLHLLPRAMVGAAGAVATAWSRLTGKALLFNAGKVRELYHLDWVAKSGLLEEYASWQPQTGFAQGFARTLNWYRREGWLPGSDDDGPLDLSRRSKGEWAA